MEAAKRDKRRNQLLEGVPTFRKTFRHIPLVVKQRAAEHGMNVSDYVNWLILEKEKEYDKHKKESPESRA